MKNDLKEDLLRAIDFALGGEWDGAHGVVQQYESDETAAWIHAVLHKLEPDMSNSRYWYRRAGKMDHVDDEARGELEGIKRSLLGSDRPNASSA